MNLLIQNLKDGKMELVEVPFPALDSCSVLVRNHYSAISVGTEGRTVKDARAGYIAKAKSRQEQVKKVIDSAKTHGVLKTYNLVMNKLTAPSPLGYSCAGEVIAVGNEITKFKVGDKVSCGGNSANHGEIVSVPQNLCAKIGDKTALQHGCFTTIGSIALQGIRQADIKIGETCAVIGLGLIGQLSMQLLEAGGISAIGIDINEDQLKLAKKIGHKQIFNRSDETLINSTKELTSGQGVDAVLICAGTNSNDPVELAGEITRKKGVVVMVGASSTDFSRPNYFKKELELKMSSSYGPGRYDANYENLGVDYPYAYVRWTENRNMQAFLNLLESSKLDIQSLITHEFEFNEAKQAYDLILKEDENPCGILLKYDLSKPLSSTKVNNAFTGLNEVKIGLIGAGNFAQNFLLPNIKQQADLLGLSTKSPATAKNIGDKYQIPNLYSSGKDLLSNEEINTVLVLTRHNTHAEFVIAALKHDKHVFVEKPLCLSETELLEIDQAYHQTKGSLVIGFNRRFSAISKKLRAELNDSPISINYRINAGKLDSSHWTQNPKIGGGRVIGEACHFIDYCSFLANSSIVSVSAFSMKSADNTNDTMSINLSFQNGSIASITYYANGNSSIEKEHVEIFSNGIIYEIEDFHTLTKFGKKVQKTKLNGQDKGYAQEVNLFIEGIKNGYSLIPYDTLYNSTLATLKVIESSRNGGQLITI